jgi:hypothetical protein
MKRLTYTIDPAFIGRLPALRERPVRSLPAVAVSIQTETPVEWQLERTPRCLLARCDQLALTLEAYDDTEARSLVAEGLQLFLLDHVEAGTFAQLLTTHGWKAELPEGTPVLEFDIPCQLDS